MFEIYALPIIIVFLGFMMGMISMIPENKNANAGKEFAFMLMTIGLVVVLLFNTKSHEQAKTNYALELYSQGKPLTSYQAKLVAGSDLYSNDQPIIFKTDKE